MLPRARVQEVNKILRKKNNKAAEVLAPELPRWGWPELFLAIQFLSTALLFIPGAQSARFLIRTLPYASSVGLLVLYLMQRKANPCVRPPAPGESDGESPAKKFVRKKAASKSVAHPTTGWAYAVVGLLILQMFHPNTHTVAGLAHIAFQICIMCPLIWGMHWVRSVAHLRRLVWLTLGCNACAVVAGYLQIYYPDQFMPSEFTSLDPMAIERLKIVLADGTETLRPPGLTDIPGGASVSAMIAGFMGVVLCLFPRIPIFLRGVCLALSACGVFVLFITQTRSLTMSMIVVVICACFFLWRQGRKVQALSIIGAGFFLLSVMFTHAVLVGGEDVLNRFMSITEEGAGESFQKNRGIFIEHTVDNLLPEYYMGAGLGRWGMMQTYFNTSKDPMSPSAPEYVEIQMTGWLLDGGVFMWFLYGGAIVSAMWYNFKVASRKGASELSYLAAVIFGFNSMIVIQSLASPTFNCQLGLEFWFLCSALYGADALDKRQHDRDLEEPKLSKVERFHAAMQAQKG